MPTAYEICFDVKVQC